MGSNWMGTGLLHPDPPRPKCGQPLSTGLPAGYNCTATPHQAWAQPHLPGRSPADPYGSVPSTSLPHRVATAKPCHWVCESHTWCAGHNSMEMWGGGSSSNQSLWAKKPRHPAGSVVDMDPSLTKKASQWYKSTNKSKLVRHDCHHVSAPPLFFFANQRS